MIWPAIYGIIAGLLAGTSTCAFLAARGHRDRIARLERDARTAELERALADPSLSLPDLTGLPPHMRTMILLVHEFRQKR